MASGQELLYTVRLKASQGDITNIQKELDKLGGDNGKSFKSQSDALKGLRQDLKSYQEALARVQKEAREFDRASEDNISTQRALGDRIDETRNRIKAASLGNIDYQTSLTQTGGSIREMKGRLRALKIAIDNVEDPLGKGAEKVKALTAEHDRLNKSIGIVEKSMGIHTRNVGNYEDGIRSAANAVAIFQGPLGPLAGRINSAATAISRFRNAQKAATITTITLGKAINIALIASGIGILIVALTSVLAFLKRTEEGQERLRIASAALGAVFNTIADIFVSVGKIIVDAIDSPMEAIKSLGNAVVQNIVNRFKAVPQIVMGAFNFITKGAASAGLAIAGIWSKKARKASKALFKEAAEDLVSFVDGVGQLGTGIDDPYSRLAKSGTDLIKTTAENVEQNKALEESLNQVLRTERDLGVQRARQNRDLQEARDMVRDLNVSFNERLDALDKVRKAEESLLKEELDNEKERLRIITERNDMFSSTAEQEQAVADQQQLIFKLEQEALQRSMSLRRDENSIIRQRDEFVLRSLRRTIENADRERQLEFERIKRGLEEQGKLVEIAEQKELDFIQNKQREQTALEEAYFQELRNQYVDESQARAEAALRAEQEIELKGIELRNNVLDAEEQRRRSKVEENANFDRMVAQREFDAELHELQKKNDRIGIIEAQRRAFQEQFEKEHSDRLFEITKELTDKGIKEAEAKNIAIARLNEERLSAEAEFSRKLFDAETENRKEMTEAVLNLTQKSLNAIFGNTKEVAVATAIIDTYKGITAALGQSPFTPLNFINAAAVGAAGFANVRKILSTKLGSKSADTSAAQVQAPKASFGLVDIPGIGGEIASQQAPAQNLQPNIILEGEFDPEFLSIKVRQGNDSISGRVVTI